MTIDNYAPCPCGSGKKMKFCKCVDQPQEYEKIVRLIDGGQELAALDRVNQLLAKTPNAAWLLAIKGELALSLREIDTFKDTALRFLKLKPDNPLALIMRAFVALIEGEPRESVARLLLEGLAESREGMPRLALSSIQLLCEQLRTSVKAPLRFYWSRLLRDLYTSTGEEMPAEEGLPADNLLAMSPIAAFPTPPGAAWAERTNEVNALISAFRYAQAETKLRSILRDYPDQAGPLTQLLQVQVVLLDQDGATTTARKLSLLRDLPEAQRDYFAAMALEFEVGQPGLRPKARTRYCEIASDEAAREALSKLETVKSIPEEFAQEMKEIMASSVNDEVPAKATYNVLTPKTLASGKQYEAGAGTLALFGRQTDKPARALIIVFDMPDTQTLFDQLVEAVGPVNDIEDPRSPRLYNYTDVLDRFRVQKSPDGAPVGLNIDEKSEAISEDFLNLALPALGGLTPLQAVEEEPKRALVRAVLTHFEAAQHIVTAAGTIDRVYQRLQFTRPNELVIDEQGEFKARTLLELTRVNIENLSNAQLGRLFASAMNLNIQNLAYWIAKDLLQRPASRETDMLRAPALSVLSQNADSAEEALSLLQQLEVALAEQGQSPGPIVMRRFSLLTSLGRNEEAQAYLRTAISEYPDDPHLISVIQYLSQQAQRGGYSDAAVDDGQLLSRMARRSEPESESGLVLPGQEQGAESGKSKLWLPGS